MFHVYWETIRVFNLLDVSRFKFLSILPFSVDQQMTESTFLSLDAETLKLFEFPLGYILKIMRVVKGVKEGKVVSTAYK